MLILSESALGQNLQIGLKVQQGEWIHAMHSECCSSENCNNHHRFRWTKVIFAMENTNEVIVWVGRQTVAIFGFSERFPARGAGQCAIWTHMRLNQIKFVNHATVNQAISQSGHLCVRPPLGTSKWCCAITFTIWLRLQFRGLGSA